MSKPVSPNYLAGYPAHLTDSVWRLIEQGQLGKVLRQKYPEAHQVRTDKALYDYVQAIKADYLRNAPQPNKVAFDGKLQTLQKALGIHSRIARVQGGKLRTKREIHVASVFRDMPAEFLRMIVVHELAHLKEPEHDKAFYQLCQHMETNYFQLEFDLRAYLCHLAAGGPPLWQADQMGLPAA
ncbi:YgjP-like metallopeptidase domain-containing protein [Dechloromonas sp. HYN0024]|uniref:YgjP-like metallopeptidase domain-containing protein n=1 Tax=Dechloromonas sp. HYN0024 TaxID=2231055 RepID=UPI000E451F01|nr:YgjP-like metallopeptidase domain-containing protein [Dechloromonas sp. HYN0024]AXS80449.1 M48 family peptidase [Dechloromonas sp. HYN0024]